jgi:hypothetical protein
MDEGRMDVYTFQSECHHVRLSADQEAFILYSKYIYTHTSINILISTPSSFQTRWLL